MRFEAEWLLECMMLRIKSPRAYETLKSSGLIPLPHRSTLQRLISGMSCHFGFNVAALEAINKALEMKRIEDRVLILCFDEMCVTASLNFNAESLAFDGFVKLSDDPIPKRENLEILELDEERHEPLNEKKSKIPQLADHALVFMCRPLVDQWVQPFGVFASKSAAPGEDLFRLPIAAIIRLDVQCGARVLVVVSDGAQTNKRVWKLAGVAIEEFKQGEEIKEKITHTMAHPTIENQEISFMQDPPHMFKCIRNQFYNHETVQVKTFSLNVIYIF